MQSILGALRITFYVLRLQRALLPTVLPLSYDVLHYSDDNWSPFYQASAGQNWVLNLSNVLQFSS